jgi:hypothetical protein
VFAVAMRDGATQAIFTLSGLKVMNRIEVLGENRTLTGKDGTFSDHFDSWAVHLYKLPLPAKPEGAAPGQ